MLGEGEMKNQNFLRIIAFILCLCSGSLLFACKRDENGGESTTDTVTESESVAETVDGTVLIDENGESAFAIIRAEHAEGYVKKCASDLYLSLKNEYPESGIKVRDDFLIRDEQPGEYEIMIGASNREGSAEFEAELADSTFGIRVTEKKVYVCASTPARIGDAVDYFTEHFLVKDGEGRVLIKHGEYRSEPVTYGLADIITAASGFTTKSTKLYDVPAVSQKRIMQGGCTDGTYMYYAMVNSGDSQTACIRKYDIKTGKLLKTGDPIATDHSNDITYIPETNQLLVCHNSPNRTMVSVVDADTLEFVKKVELPFKIFSISYQPEREVYVVGISGGQDFSILNKNFKVDRNYLPSTDRFTAVNTEFTTQGMETDINYIYFVQYKTNVIMVYDWKGKYVNQIPLDIPSNTEPENISLVGDCFYIACNNPKWTGGIVYKTEIIAPNAK
jgi:hypothetical protein